MFEDNVGPQNARSVSVSRGRGAAHDQKPRLSPDKNGWQSVGLCRWVDVHFDIKTNKLNTGGWTIFGGRSVCAYRSAAVLLW
ncbi:MAG TPA: hypothetical protein DEF21_16895 [Thalassospira lucentensis]|uniref:Uncharacterized protein n=1 Tax=Thalassospira lucentensis TaxID=168935 RepID=A0A358HX34_9PROT|nr:hypothetical protein [Thalassospira lucentensis]HCW67027.1 hypothetical protein [Thalassospira lucentensis]